MNNKGRNRLFSGEVMDILDWIKRQQRTTQTQKGVVRCRYENVVTLPRAADNPVPSASCESAPLTWQDHFGVEIEKKHNFC